MSHAATKWAFDQPKIFPDMKPNEQVVLFHLADCHNPAYGCFPRQDYIREKTNLSERSIRDQLERLRERGLVDWDAARDASGHKLNRYRLAFEDGFVPANPAGTNATPEEEPPANLAGGIGDEPPADFAGATGKFRQTHRQILPLHKEEPVKEPVKEPLREARASERAGDPSSDDGPSDDAKTIDRAFWRIVKGWPGFDGMPKEAAKPAFVALTVDERAEAERKLPGWLVLLRSQRKSHTPAPSTYFRERLWRDVPEPSAPAAASHVSAPAFGLAWGAARMASLIAGPTGPEPQLTKVERMLIERGEWSAEQLMADKRVRTGWPDVNAMHDRAEIRGATQVAARFAELRDVMEAVPINTPMFAAWQAHHAAMGWPWIPDPGALRVVWFPRGGPEGLAAFETALAAGGAGR